MLPQVKNFIQAPWVIIRRDLNNPEFLLIQNNLLRKRYRLPERMAGMPLGKGEASYIPFLLAEKLIATQRQIADELMFEAHAFKNRFEKGEQIVTFIPNYNCHFKCDYCYNHQTRDAKESKRLPAEEIVGIIAPVYKKSPAHKRRLDVTGGGEPLSDCEYLAKVASILQEQAREDGCSFSMSVITNGDLLNNKNVSGLMRAGLRTVRVTLDPDHDKVRVMANGAPTFDRIVSNIEALPAELELQVQSNVPPGKLDTFRELLKKLGALRGRVSDFGVSLIMPQVSGGEVTENRPYSRMYDSESVEFLLELVEAIDEAGFTRKNDWPRIECEATRRSENVTVNMKGETTFCPGVDGLEKYKTQLRDGEQSGEIYEEVDRDKLSRSFCFDAGEPCAWQFLCYTGCRLLSVSQNLGWSVANCEKLYLERMTEYELVRFSEKIRS